MFWKRRKEGKVESGSAGMFDKAARWILSLQRRGADRLNGVVAGLPVKKMKVALGLFCLLAGGFSGYLVIGGIVGEKKVTPALQIEPTSVPKHYNESGNAGVGEDRLDEQTAEQLRAVKTYLDSLSLHDRKAYDSLVRTRPGWMDTVRALEEIYLTQ